MSLDQQSLNPYIGPRPFSQDPVDRLRFFGRERETQDIVSLVLSHRILLVYAASGAGKTSLFNAKIIPEMEVEFGCEVFPMARVRGVAPEGLAPDNQYVFNALVGLGADQEDLASKSLKAYLDEKPRQVDPDGEPALRILVFDQLEEIFEYYPPGWKAQRTDFFEQVTEALENDPFLRIVFVMREDYVARMKPYESLLPERLETRFRIELLEENQALQAIERPPRAIQSDRSYAPEASQALVKRLMKVLTQNELGERLEVEGDHVEPVQLQVVCQTLWDEIPAGTTQISKTHIENFDIKSALANFYEKSIRAAQKNYRISEKRLRDWFKDYLVTPLGTRSTVVMEVESTGGIPNTLVEYLDREMHLVRTVQRRGATWVELTHDSLVQPILESNRAWRDRRRNRFSWMAAGTSSILILLIIVILKLQSQAAQTSIMRSAATLAQQTAAAKFTAENAALISEATANSIAAETAAASATANFRAQQTAGAKTATASFFAQGTADALSLATATEITIQQTAQAEAEEKARLSLMRQLAAQASDTLDKELDLSRLLAVKAFLTADTLESRSSLLRSLMFERQLYGHTSWLTSVAFSPDGAILATASDDNTIILWDVNTGMMLYEPLAEHRDLVSNIDFSPDGRILASGDREGVIILWDVASGKSLYEVGAGGLSVWDVAFSPDGTFLASGGDDRRIRLWEVSQVSGKFTLTEDAVGDNRSVVRCVAWGPDGNRLASCGRDGLVRIWDRALEKPIHVLGPHTDQVSSAAWSPNGQMLATSSANSVTGGKDSNILLWSPEKGQPIGRLAGHQGGVTGLAFSPDGNILASASIDKTVILWDVNKRKQITLPLRKHGHWVMDVAFSPDGRTLATGSVDQTAILWNIPARIDMRRTLFGHTGGVNSVAISPDGRLLASGGPDGTVRLWDVTTGEELDNMIIGPDRSVRSVAFSPDGKLLASGSSENTIRLWYLSESRLSGELFGHGNTVLSLAFSPVGGTVDLASGDADGTIRLWDLSTRSSIVLFDGQGGWLYSLAFSPDGQLLASGAGDNTVRLWDVEAPKMVAELGRHSNWVYSIAFSPDGRTLVSGSEDANIISWDVETRKKIGIIPLAHRDGVRSVAFSPDGKLLASGGDDWLVRLWDGSQIISYWDPLEGHQERVRSVAFSPDSKVLASGSDDSTIILWNLDPDTWIELACSLAGRNFSLAEWERYIGPISPEAPYVRTCSAFPPGEGLGDLSSTPTPISSPRP